MHLPRRAFLGKAVLTGIAVNFSFDAMTVAAFSPIAPQKPDGPVLHGRSALSKASFEERIGTTFRIRYQQDFRHNVWIDADLVAVEDLMISPEQTAAGGECFRVVLQTVGDPELSQGTYQVDSSELGSLAILLVPGDVDVKGNRAYTAVFNHLGTNRWAPTRK